MAAIIDNLHLKEPPLKDHNFLSGEELLALPNLPRFTGQISEMLSQSPFLVNYSSSELLGYIERGHSVLGVENGFWTAHAKLQVYEATADIPDVVELGSVLVAPDYRGVGFGNLIVTHSLLLAAKEFPGTQIIAVVSKGNSSANLLFGQFSDTLIPQPANVPVKILGEKKIYDLTQAAIELSELSQDFR